MNVPMQDRATARQLPFVPAVLQRITWQVVLGVQAVGLAAALLVYLQDDWPNPPPYVWERLVISRAVAAFFVMLGALAADEAIRRGQRFWRAYLVALLVSASVAAVVQWYLRRFLGYTVIALDLPVLSGMLTLTMVFAAFGGIALLAYLNRQSALRMLEGVRRGELERLQVERRLLDSRLATAQAQLDPAAVLRQLAEIRSLYGAAQPAADQKLEQLIQDLRSSVARSAAVGSPGAGPS